jgi:hypothetical protein
MATLETTRDKILFVTSFEKRMYDASGHKLLDSFHRYKQAGPMLCCYEGMSPPAMKNTLWYNLDQDEFLQTWLANNKDVIPEHLGGTTTQCNCKDAHVKHSKHHTKGCYWAWPNRNASRWFRKVATWRYAATRGYQHICWLDVDCHFKRDLPRDKFIEFLAGSGLFYFRGHRPAVESGILGFDLQAGGQQFVDAICNVYTSRRYLKYDRWDDGYVVGKIVESEKIAAHDMVHPTRWRHRTNDVIPTTPISQYIVHRKGDHGRANIML